MLESLKLERLSPASRFGTPSAGSRSGERGAGILPERLYYTILYCTVLYYTILDYTVLYCTMG